MKKKILWLMLSFLLVAALVLASCGEAAPGEQEEEEEEEEEGVPKHGGTLTYLAWSLISGADPPSPDVALGYFHPTQWLSFCLERPMIGDLDYGPRGTDEFAFQSDHFVPEKFLKGLLLEDWEISYEEAIWHVKPGIMWQDNPYLGFDFEPRELTAQDIVEDLMYYRDGVAGTRFRAMSGEIYATDRYTLVIKTPPGFNASMVFAIGYENRQLVTPPEMVVAGAGEWANQVGTGPYMLKEYDIGSHMTFVRNPNYHQTATIDGVVYQLPFVDELVCPIIADESSRIAALRTGTVDIYQKTPVEQWKTLDVTAPGILSIKFGGGGGKSLMFKCNEPPVDDVNVRRALFIGTDLKAFGDALGVGPLPVDWWPTYPGNPEVHTPLEDLPADCRILYDYNPTLAMEMLETAVGPPDAEGIFFTIQFYTDNSPSALDRGALLQAQWAKIGVTLDIKSSDATTLFAHIYDRTYHHSAESNPSNAGPTTILIGRVTGAYQNYGEFSNDDFDALLGQLLGEMDSAKRNSMIREAALITLREAIDIPLTVQPGGIYWWPWLKNYYGETNVQDIGQQAVMTYVWIDQDLKDDMGF